MLLGKVLSTSILMTDTHPLSRNVLTPSKPRQVYLAPCQVLPRWWIIYSPCQMKIFSTENLEPLCPDLYSFQTQLPVSSAMPSEVVWYPPLGRTEPTTFRLRRRFSFPPDSRHAFMTPLFPSHAFRASMASKFCFALVALLTDIFLHFLTKTALKCS